MKQFFKDRQFTLLIMYFLLAVAIIIAYKAIQEIEVAFVFFRRIGAIVAPFAYGFLTAYVLNIPCSGIEKLFMKTRNKFICSRSRVFSVIITYILLFLLFFLVLRLIIPSIYNSIYLFGANFKTYYNRAEELIQSINEQEFINFDLSMEQIMTFIQDFGLEKLPNSLNAIFGFSTALFSGFLAFISSIYILFEKENFTKYLCRILKVFLPDTVYEGTLRYSRALNTNFKQYIYTQTLDGCILGTLAIIELSLLRSPYALILGIMLGIVNYIPYFGSIFGSIITVIVVAFTQSLPTAGITAVVLLITQQIDSNVIQPKLMGGSFSLSPLLVIISITIGGAFYGILGMLAAIPIVAVMKNILDELTLYYENKRAEINE